MVYKKWWAILLFFNTAYAVMPGALGEKNFNEFAPVNHLFFEKEQYQGKLIFRDTSLDEKYIDRLFEPQIWDLNLFINWELYNANQCPNEVLSKNFDLYRFLYRALTISYLYENIKDMRGEAQKLNFKTACDFDFKKEFSHCGPQSKDMKIFLSNAVLFLEQDNPVLEASHNYASYLTRWVKDYHNSKKYNPSKARVRTYCQKGHCKNFSKKKLEEYFIKSCDEDLKLLKNICNERDHIYGLASVTEANYILSRSELLQTFEDEGVMLGCLRRFSELLKNQELGVRSLESIYSNVFQELQRKKAPYLAGELFRAANLKMFTDKGLSQILKKEEPEKKTVVVVPLKKPEPPKKIEIPKKVVKVETKKIEPIKVVEKPAPKEEPKPQYSAFLTAIKFMQDYHLPLVKVDMLKLRYDYIFAPNVVGVMEKTIDKYMALKALNEMKRFDKLGTKKGPVPLMFIKYMIDQEKHKGLYNLINTLGNKFYVENDLDGKELASVQYIEIKNDESTKNIWQIYVLNDSL